jgi:hypothetical protein
MGGDPSGPPVALDCDGGAILNHELTKAPLLES